MEGDLKPGSSPAAISFGGDLVLGQSARTQIELGGTIADTQHDQLNVVGTLSLASLLDLLVIDGYTDPAVPAAADDFVLVNASDIAGAFTTVDYDGVPLMPAVRSAATRATACSATSLTRRRPSSSKT